MASPESPTPSEWLQRYCPSLDGQFLFLDPVSWQTFQLTEGAVTVLQEAAAAIEQGRFDVFQEEVADAGGWPAGLEFLARTLTTLQHSIESSPSA
jgi:hypothetical protein